MRVFITWDDPQVAKMFKDKGWEVTKDFSSSFDLLCLPGGIDINPFLYGERPRQTAYFNTRRDNCEITYWKALPCTLTTAAFWSGSHLWNVLCGGSLWPDVNEHFTQHPINDHAFTDEWKFSLASSGLHLMSRITDDALLRAGARRST